MSRITENPEKIRELLFNTLDTLIINRKKDEAFLDEVEVKKQDYFSTLEGLECLLIPLANLPRNLFWFPIIEKHADLKDMLKKDIVYILSLNRDHETPPPEQGNPYFVTKERDLIHGPYWSSECVSFTISTLTNILELDRKFNVFPWMDHKEIVKIIKKNIAWLKPTEKKKGWAWLAGQEDEHPWPTWSLLDTFEEVVDYESTENIFKSLGNKCKSYADKIVEGFEDSASENSYLKRWENSVAKSRSYDVTEALDLTRLMVGACLHKEAKTIYHFAVRLYTWAKKSDFSDVKYQYKLGENKTIYDYSLVPSVFRALIIMADRLTARKLDDLGEEIGSKPDYVINRVFNELEKNLIKQGKYENLWGIELGGQKYELYFTERTIEAFTEFLLKYKPETKKVKKPKKLEKKTKKNSDKLETISLFYSYSHDDKDLRKSLEKHLSFLRRDEFIAGWKDREISAGKELDPEISENLKKSKIILLLVSASFYDSDYCHGKEMKYALKMHKEGKARVIPIILRDCDWNSAPFGGLKALPEDGKAVTGDHWKNEDMAFTDIAKEIRKVVKEIRENKS